MSNSARLRGTAMGIASAALFGASAPFSKLLLPGVGMVMLASLLYLGAGIGLSLFQLVRPRRSRVREAPLRRADWGLLAGIVVFGGILGPILMLFGLGRLSGLAGSLLLNLEAPFTMLLALVVFGEHLARREIAGAAFIVAGAAALGYRPGELGGDWLGVAAVAGACLSWGIDNNLTQKLSLRDPIAVTQVKALGAGTANLAIAFATGAALPRPGLLLPALAVGTLGYGLSIVLNMYALRTLGAARQAAYFATAPFAGALLAVPLLGERPASADWLAGAVMFAGVVLLLRARHAHLHTHQELVHEHQHVHDEHHQHVHDPDTPAGEPHSHRHRHEPLTHEHPHLSDLHHRHKH